MQVGQKTPRQSGSEADGGQAKDPMQSSYLKHVVAVDVSVREVAVSVTLVREEDCEVRVAVGVVDVRDAVKLDVDVIELVTV